MRTVEISTKQVQPKVNQVSPLEGSRPTDQRKKSLNTRRYRNLSERFK